MFPVLRSDGPAGAAGSGAAAEPTGRETTDQAKVTSPPVSGTELGLAVLVTWMSGATSSKVTVALSLSSAVVPSSSVPTAVVTL